MKFKLISNMHGYPNVHLLIKVNTNLNIIPMKMAIISKMRVLNEVVVVLNGF